MYVYLLLLQQQLLYTQHILKMFFTEDCLVTDATFEDEILKIVKWIQGYALTHICPKHNLWMFWGQLSPTSNWH